MCTWAGAGRRRENRRRRQLQWRHSYRHFNPAPDRRRQIIVDPLDLPIKFGSSFPLLKTNISSRLILHIGNINYLANLEEMLVLRAKWPLQEAIIGNDLAHC